MPTGLAAFLPLGNVSMFWILTSVLVLTSCRNPLAGKGRYQEEVQKEDLYPYSQVEKWGFANQNGEVRIKPQFDSAFPFTENLGAVSTDGNWYFIDPSGKQAIQTRFSRVRSFSEGLACVKDFDNQWFYIDREGKQKIKATFKSAFSFREGRALIRRDNKYGFIDKSGRVVISPQFAQARAFAYGYAAVYDGKQWGYIHRNGNLAIGFSFREASSFTGKTALVSSGGEWRTLNLDGSIQKGVIRLPVVRFASIPTGAEVFAFSNTVWEAHPNILNDDNLLQRYRINGKVTTFAIDTQPEIFWCVMRLKGQAHLRYVPWPRKSPHEVSVRHITQ